MFEERTEFRDRNGWFTGKAITRDNKTAFYDRNGHYQGTARQRDAWQDSRLTLLQRQGRQQGDVS